MFAVVRIASQWGPEREMSRHAAWVDAADARLMLAKQITNAGSGTNAELERELANFEIKDV
jgi:hypothetical protein